MINRRVALALKISDIEMEIEECLERGDREGARKAHRNLKRLERLEKGNAWRSTGGKWLWQE